jgi:hypothetical protein
MATNVASGAKAPTNQQLIERWQNVLRVLRALTPHQRKRHWDMQTYGQATDCGTVACAAGHCGLDPWFRRRGIKTTVDSRWGWDTHFGRPNQRVMQLSEFFGEDGVDNIFLNTDRRSVGEVIREVKAHIKALQSSAVSSEKSQ